VDAVNSFPVSGYPDDHNTAVTPTSIVGMLRYHFTLRGTSDSDLITGTCQIKMPSGGIQVVSVEVEVGVKILGARVITLSF
jgi:hypothetical protein